MVLYLPTLHFHLCIYVSFVCRYVAHPGECYYNTLLCCDYFSLSSVVSRTFSVLCVYSKFRHHPHPLGYLCAKFHFFLGLHCWASPWRKIVYSFTQSLTHSPSLFYAPGFKLALRKLLIDSNISSSSNTGVNQVLIVQCWGPVAALGINSICQKIQPQLSLSTCCELM